jgi:hypothetical protein
MPDKLIEISEHARNRAILRGALESEIIETVAKGEISIAAHGRKRARLKFLFNKVLPANAKFYSHKIIETIYADEVDKLVVVTVKVYFLNQGD